MMKREDVEKFIKKNKARHLSNKVLHAHPSPALWKKEFNRVDVEHALLSSYESRSTSVNMYVGIPYCLPTDPPHCGFCLFPTEKYKGKKETSNYLNYVEKEAELYKEFYANSTIDTLYIGGGTPNLLAPKDYFLLMKIIEDLFPKMNQEIEKTLEGIPQLFNEEKIRAISESGFNRVSMGVQQVSDKLIKYSGRKQTRKQIFDAIDLFHKYDLSCNVDLIYGWPEQTIDDMLSDLEAIVHSGIRHITHYELNIAGRTDFATQQRSLVAPIEEKIKMFNEAKAYLQSHGFKQKTIYDWEKASTSEQVNSSEKYLYEDNLRDFMKSGEEQRTSAMGGLGFAAVNMRMQPIHSTLSSISTMNHKSLNKYYEDVLEGQFPIERSFLHDKEDVKLVWIFQALQEMKIDVKKYKSIFHASLLDEFHEIWMALDREGWITYNEDEILLIGEGEFYVPLIQSLVSKFRVDNLVKGQKKFEQVS